MHFRILLTLSLAIVPAWAADTSIAQRYEDLINNAGNGNIPEPEDLMEAVNETTLRGLSAADIQNLLPLGKRCLESQNETIRRDGILLLMGIALRSDSTVLIEPYIGDLELIANNPTDGLKEGALYILANTKPKISTKARGFLSAHLTDKSNSAGQRLMIASSLLRNNANQQTIESVVQFAETESDTSVKAGILMQLRSRASAVLAEAQ
jgi:hypothetical protein